MSVLKSLKGTLQNVQQDIVESFRSLASLDASMQQRKELELLPQGVSLDAGADLLFRYQKDWSEMQSYTTESALKAEEVDQLIRQLLIWGEQFGRSARRLEEEASTLPSISHTLQEMLEVIESLHEDFQVVEEEIERLQDVREQESLRHQQLSHCSQLAAYTKTRHAEALAVKEQLWRQLRAQATQGRARRRHSSIADQEMDQKWTEMDLLSPPQSDNTAMESSTAASAAGPDSLLTEIQDTPPPPPSTSGNTSDAEDGQ